MGVAGAGGLSGPTPKRVLRDEERGEGRGGPALQTLKAERDRAVHAEQAPATLRMLLEHYVADLEQRGKGDDTVIRATSTAKMIERVTPVLLDMPVSAIGDAEIFAFRNARAREGKVVYETVAGEEQERRVPNKPSTINRDLRTLRAALKKARPEYRFLAAHSSRGHLRLGLARPRREVGGVTAHDPGADPTARDNEDEQQEQGGSECGAAPGGGRQEEGEGHGSRQIHREPLDLPTSQANNAPTRTSAASATNNSSSTAVRGRRTKPPSRVLRTGRHPRVGMRRSTSPLHRCSRSRVPCVVW